jgi:hypothetical protein
MNAVQRAVVEEERGYILRALKFHMGVSQPDMQRSAAKGFYELVRNADVRIDDEAAAKPALARNDEGGLTVGKGPGDDADDRVLPSPERVIGGRRHRTSPKDSRMVPGED